jgi:hypothetical protein
MKADGDAERLGTFENGPEEFVIEIAAAMVAVDGGAFEVLLVDGSLQFRRGFGRIGDGEGGEAGEAAGVAGHGGGLGGIGLFGAGRGERKDLHVDPGGVHFGDAPDRLRAAFRGRRGRDRRGGRCVRPGLGPAQREIPA